MAKQTNGGERDRLDLRFDPDLRRRIESQRERFAESLSAYIRRAIAERLERDEASDPRKKKNGDKKST